MAVTTKISWTDATWNIAVGCTKVDADCKYCYMFRESMMGKRFTPGQVRRTKTVFNLPLALKTPRRIFVSSLTDFFHPDIDSFRNEAWDIIRKCPQHTFQILTKRPERIKDHLPADWGTGYPNVWLGTSIGSQNADHRVAPLLETPAAVRFLSLEPLHGPVDLTSIKGNAGSVYQILEPITNCGDSNRPAIDWVIVGGESGNNTGHYRYRPCELSWIQTIVDQCTKAGKPVFVKQLGTHLAKQLNLKNRHAADITEWPASLQIQQFPK